MAKRTCPHADIRFCPLYIEAHRASGLGCSLVDPDHCDHAGARSYEAAIARLCHDPVGRDTVLTCAAGRSAEEARQQRKRNLRAAGLR